MDKLRMQSFDKIGDNIKKIASLFPQCVTERMGKNGKPELAIDFEKLKNELSGEVIEEGEERYQFTWPGKRVASRLANKTTTQTLRPCREESVDFDHTQNLYIKGDNLDVLKVLRETYLGKVKMIYIDPPYNTGNDFVYNDDFAQSRNEFEETSGLFDEDGNQTIDPMQRNTESNGRFHTDWLNMMYPRLKVAKDLLTDDGAIFISIDDNEVENLRKICDEIFGERSFIGQITLLCNPKGRSQDKYIANCHEYILIYSTPKYILPAGSVSIPKTLDEIKKDYPNTDSNGSVYREIELRNTHREFGKFNRPKLWYPIYVAQDGSVSITSDIDGATPIYPTWDDGFEGCWTWGKEKASSNIHLLIAKKVNGNIKIYRKAYAYEEDNIPLKQVKSIWNDKVFFTEKGQLTINQIFQMKDKIFQSPKSVMMIRQCLLMAQHKDALILDFFSGSATTAHAVMQLNAEDGGNRKFIMVQLPEKTDEKSEAFKAGYKNICEIGEERIRRAGKKIKEDNKDKEGIEKLDTGFRVLKLDSSNMNDVYYTPEEFSQYTLFSENVKQDRTSEDLLFQVMLDLGIELSARIEKHQIARKEIYLVDGNYLVACFDSDVDETAITEMAKMRPVYFVMRDSSRASDSVADNFEQLFKCYSPDTICKVL